MEAGTQIKEYNVASECCIKILSSKSCEQPTITEHQILQIEYNVEHVASDEVLMEGDTVKDDHEPTKANKKFQ